LILLPFVFSLCADAVVSLGRISEFLVAEELAPPYPIDPSLKYAVDVDADFTWEVSDPAKAGGEDAPKKGKQSKEEKAKAKKEKKKKGGTSEQPSEEPSHTGTVIAEPAEIFTLKNIKMQIQPGQFVAIVGRIGSGKSSFFNAMIGEMRKTRGEVFQSFLDRYLCLPLVIGCIQFRHCIYATGSLVGKCYSTR
jgi:ATP-binding cassette subfamily C (CFTR/MRP) protein 1